MSSGVPMRLSNTLIRGYKRIVVMNSVQCHCQPDIVVALTSNI